MLAIHSIFVIFWYSFATSPTLFIFNEFCIRQEQHVRIVGHEEGYNNRGLLRDAPGILPIRDPMDHQRDP